MGRTEKLVLPMVMRCWLFSRDFFKFGCHLSTDPFTAAWRRSCGTPCGFWWKLGHWHSGIVDLPERHKIRLAGPSARSFFGVFFTDCHPQAHWTTAEVFQSRDWLRNAFEDEVQAVLTWISSPLIGDFFGFPDHRRSTQRVDFQAKLCLYRIIYNKCIYIYI